VVEVLFFLVGVVVGYGLLWLVDELVRRRK
jgi:hypothetical protein